MGLKSLVFYEHGSPGSKVMTQLSFPEHVGISNMPALLPTEWVSVVLKKIPEINGGE